MPTIVTINSCLWMASRLAWASASLFSARTSRLIFSSSKYLDRPYRWVINSFNCSSASAAFLNFAHLSKAVCEALWPDTPFFCRVFLAASVASKNWPICLLRDASDLPALNPNLIEDNKLIGSIFYLPSEWIGLLVKYSNVFSRVLIRACNLTIWLNWSKKPSCVS